jgi:hypothetical protein
MPRQRGERGDRAACIDIDPETPYAELLEVDDPLKHIA